jgi:arylformamidase
MDRNLDEPPPDLFKIRAIVPHFEATVADYKTSSAATRARLPSRLDVAYGDDPDERLDLFFPETSAAAARLPIHLFIHGGYWRAQSKADYSYLADVIVGQGAIAAIADYSLMPGARMARLVDQARRAAHWLGEHGREFGGDPTALSASGHSAGGHLTTYLCCRAPHESEFPDNPCAQSCPLAASMTSRRSQQAFCKRNCI